MSDFQTVKRRNAALNNSFLSNNLCTKYPEAQLTLLEMGFDSNAVNHALEEYQGDLEAASVSLFQQHRDSYSNYDNSPSKTETKGSPIRVSQEITKTLKEIHNRMISTYKVQKCKDPNPSHDRKTCVFNHGSTDRRRNPFEFTYSCYECPNNLDGSECRLGESCDYSHTMLERMFHPELYKISMCQRVLNGGKCERGLLCAFAHSDMDLRISPSHLSTRHSIPIESKSPPRPIADSPMIDSVREKLVRLIKDAGPEGVLGSELPKRYFTRFHESIDLLDETGSKFKIKDIIGNHANVSVVLYRGVQPRYLYDENKSGNRSWPLPETTDVDTDKSPTRKIANSNYSFGGDLSLDSVRDRLIDLIKSYSNEGILGSDIPKKYLEMWGEKLEVTDDSGGKMRLKEIINNVPGIVIHLYKLQPKYVYDHTAALRANALAKTSESSALESAAGSITTPKSKTWSAIAASTTAGTSISMGSEVQSLFQLNAAVARDFSKSLASDTAPPIPLYKLLDDAAESKSGQQLSLLSRPLDINSSLDSPMRRMEILNSTLMLSPGGTSDLLSGMPSLAPPGIIAHRSLSNILNSTTSPAGIAQLSNNSNPSNNDLQQKVYILEKELTDKNADLDNQNMQIKALLNRITESDSKFAASGEVQKSVIKMKDDELAARSKDITKLEEENKRLKEEKLIDLNQFYMTLGTIEETIAKLKCKDDAMSERITADDVQELFNLKKAVRIYVSNMRVNVKNKFETIASQITMKTASPPATRTMADNETQNVGTASTSSPASSVLSSPAGSRFNLGGFQDNNAFRSTNISPGGAAAVDSWSDPFRNFASTNPVNSAPELGSKLCGLPGCFNEGLYTCAGCQKVVYCGDQHQRNHWPQHSQSCYSRL